MRYLKNKYTFHVNSNQRSSGDNNFNFRYKINLPVDADVNRICLLDAQIPKSYYVVQDNYNTFQLSENGVTRTITLTAGNYNRKTFSQYLTTALNTGGVGYTYTVTYNNSSSYDTGKYYYTCSETSLPVQIIFTAINQLYAQMGFNIGSTNEFVSGSLTSTNIINLQSENSIYLHCDAISNQEGDDVLSILYGSSNSDFSFIDYQTTSIEGYERKLASVTNELGFTLSDENGVLINLNGINITFTIIIYKVITLDETIENFIKYAITHIEEQDNKEKNK